MHDDLRLAVNLPVGHSVSPGPVILTALSSLYRKYCQHYDRSVRHGASLMMHNVSFMQKLKKQYLNSHLTF